MKPQPWDTSGMRTLRKPPRSASSVPPSPRRDSGSRRLVSDHPQSVSGTVDARSGGRRANESRRGLGGLRGAVRDLRAAAGGFGRGQRAGVAIESAFALTVLVVAFAGLMEIVQASYTDDRMGRAARAAARVLALDPTADACAAIRSEFRLAKDFDCGAWTLTPYFGVAPSALPATVDAAVTTGTGDMVLVRIGWNRNLRAFDGLAQEANADDGLEDAGDDAADAGTVRMVAIGLARCEAELCGQGTS